MTTDPQDRAELVDLMSRYATMADARRWDDLPRTVFCDEITCDFSTLGSPVTTMTREAWVRQTERSFAGWVATHHAITNHLIDVDGDRATIRAHVRVEHWAPESVAAGGAACWLVVGFYDDVAQRTDEGWRLRSVTLRATYQENAGLLARVLGLTAPAPAAPTTPPP